MAGFDVTVDKMGLMSNFVFFLFHSLPENLRWYLFVCCNGLMRIFSCYNGL